MPYVLYLHKLYYGHYDNDLDVLYDIRLHDLDKPYIAYPSNDLYVLHELPGFEPGT